MCGIVGAILPARDSVSLTPTVGRMLSHVAHRGPDGTDIFCDFDFGFGFGHQRLSILDHSSAGSQPIWSKNGHTIVVFNGEIYNHSDLREKLSSEGHATHWSGHSDAETLVELLSTWGTRKTLEALRGMFAFASFDYRTSKLTLARDIAGEKPLLWGRVGAKLGFASELTALESLFGDSLTLSESALSDYMDLSYVPPTSTIYAEVHKVPPGGFVELCVPELSTVDTVPELYWKCQGLAISSQLEQSPGRETVDHQLDTLANILKSSVGSQLVADVPVGAFLSGGIDSSLVTAIGVEHNPELQTFTLGFQDSELNEAPHAKRVARYLGTRHHEIYVSNSELACVAVGAVRRLDEPFGDSSAIPSLILSDYAKSQVSAVITGDGGDELFGGYERYQRIRRLEKALRIPFSIRRLIFRDENYDSDLFARALTLPFAMLDHRRFGSGKGEEKLRKLTSWLGASDVRESYLRQISSNGSAFLRNPHRLGNHNVRFWPPDIGAFEAALAYDFGTYLPADILHKADRTSMASGLESRAPLLGREVIEFAFSLESSKKIQSGRGKLPLRQLLGRYVPEKLWDRPKAGFSVPMAELLRNELVTWAHELVYPARNLENDLFNYPEIQKVWERHLSGRVDQSTRLWNFLFLSDWLNNRGSKKSEGKGGKECC